MFPALIRSVVSFGNTTHISEITKEVRKHCSNLNCEANLNVTDIKGLAAEAKADASLINTLYINIDIRRKPILANNSNRQTRC